MFVASPEQLASVVHELAQAVEEGTTVFVESGQSVVGSFALLQVAPDELDHLRSDASDADPVTSPATG